MKVAEVTRSMVEIFFIRCIGVGKRFILEKRTRYNIAKTKY